MKGRIWFHRALAAALLTVSMSLAAYGASADYDSAVSKFDSVKNEEVPRGSTVSLTPAEVNAWVVGKATEDAPGGLNNIQVTLAQDALTWSGLVNFANLPQLAAIRDNWLVSQVLKGEKNVVIEASLQSSAGKATAEVQSVTIEGTRFEGNTLQFFVQKLLDSMVDGATLGEPFDLEHNVEQIRLRPDGIHIKIFD